MEKKVFKAAILELMEEYAQNKMKGSRARNKDRKAVFERLNSHMEEIVDGYIDDYTEYLAMYVYGKKSKVSS